MISRRTASALGNVYEKMFGYSTYVPTSRGSSYRTYHVRKAEFYDFLYDRGYEPWLCNAVKVIRSNEYRVKDRAVKELVMQFHTGETLAHATPKMGWEERETIGQRYLRDLAQDMLIYWYDASRETNDRLHSSIQELQSRLELDGYEYRDSYLLAPESDVLDVEEETGVLESLYLELVLPEKESNFHFLQLSEEHYLAGRWGDSISNSRKFLEGTLREVAVVHSSRVKRAEISEGTYKRAVRVREYLKQESLLDTKEMETLAKVYGLLSETGSHPFMPHNEQARLLRHLALTFAQFVMIRLQGSLKNV